MCTSTEVANIVISIRLPDARHGDIRRAYSPTMNEVRNESGACVNDDRFDQTLKGANSVPRRHPHIATRRRNHFSETGFQKIFSCAMELKSCMTHECSDAMEPAAGKLGAVTLQGPTGCSTMLFQSIRTAQVTKSDHE